MKTLSSDSTTDAAAAPDRRLAFSVSAAPETDRNFRLVKFLRRLDPCRLELDGADMREALILTKRMAFAKNLWFPFGPRSSPRRVIYSSAINARHANI